MKENIKGFSFLKGEFWRGFLFVCVLFFFLFLIVSVNHLMASFIVALVINFMITPVIDLLERKGIKRLYSILTSFSLLTVLFVFFSFKFYPILVSQLSLLKTEWPVYWQKVVDQIDLLQNQFLHTRLFDKTNIFEVIKDSLLKGTPKVFETVPALFSQSLTILILAPFLSFFMLLDGRRAMKKFCELIPNSIFEITLSLQSQIDFQLGQFIRSRLIASFFVGLFVGLGLLSNGTPFSFSLGVFAGLANLIPYIGPFLSAVPALFLGFVKSYGVFDFFMLLLPYVIAQVIDGLIIMPFIVARLVNLHPVTILISLLAGAQVLGVLGMLVAIPLVFTAKLILLTFHKHTITPRL